MDEVSFRSTTAGNQKERKVTLAQKGQVDPGGFKTSDVIEFKKNKIRKYSIYSLFSVYFDNHSVAHSWPPSGCGALLESLCMSEC